MSAAVTRGGSTGVRPSSSPGSVVIHKNERISLEIMARTRRYVQVRGDGDRVRISAGAGKSAESWSFVPPDDPVGWAEDIRESRRSAG